MKIIFLDIDGVLNSDKYLAARSDQREEDRIDLSRVKLLADLVQSTDAGLVLTSTWRLDWNGTASLCGDSGKYLNECLAQYGLSIRDKTPIIGLLGGRRKEIAAWLSHHPGDVESFVIFDDMDYGWEELRSRVVVTNPRGLGLEEEHVAQAREVLNTRIEVS